MPKKLTFDDGIQSIEINGGECLRFNPTDFNVYNRFLELSDEITKIEQEFLAEIEKAEGDSVKTLKTMRQYDAKIKERLTYTFGMGNDFDRILKGVNLMAVGHNGEFILTNLIQALKPIIDEGLKQFRASEAEQAVAEAKQNRAQRRAKA